MTSVGAHWASLSPASYQNAQVAIRRRAGPTAWDKAVAPVLRLPAWLVFGTLGFGLAWAGRRRHDVEVFAN
jgi:hypothetical protein